MSRRKRGGEAHVRLYRHEHESPAYQSLSPEVRALLVEFRALYDGRENRVHMSVREIRRRLNGIGQVKAERARDELLDRGFIRLLTPGKFTRKDRHAAEYALTHEPLDNGMGATAPKDFMRWEPQKNTVRMTSTVGTDDEYREPGNPPEKPAHGTDDEYREGPNAHGHGTDDEYTDRVTTGGSGGWLAEYMGWPCRNKSVLDTCCLVCGVWITSGRYEFDGAQHSCDPVSRARYREQFQATTDQRLAA